MRIGIDAGGTFTDFIVLGDDGGIATFKIRSNPKNPASVILEGLRRAGALAKTEVIHGSTVATNALLERKGARTAFVTTEGFEDILEIGRQNRAELYNLTPLPRRLLADLRYGVGERIFFDGTVESRPSRAALAKLRKQLQADGAESVAICFLHSYQNGENEKAAAEALAGDFYLCASHEVCPEFREYERASTTVVNAYVGPLMDAYLGDLERLSKQRISIMQSNGGLIRASEARKHAVRTILSGPAGGVVGALETAKLSGHSRILGFDMGGTSTDVCLCDGVPRESSEAYLDGFPIRVPLLDIHTVGAGGGSIARVDDGGLLRVGPESAGADPGPACYGAGDRATVTDAHVVLGRIAADQFLGGAMRIDSSRAEAAIDGIATALACSRVAAAEGILCVANANMERAIRAVSIERGFDPRDFALVAFGGCGGLHACDIAAELGIATVIVPQFAGALSALGMVLADHARDYAAGALGRADREARFSALEKKARKDLAGAALHRFADLRYRGQSYEITIPWTVSWQAAFHAEHQRLYGYHDTAREIEAVTLRVRAVRTTVKPRLAGLAADTTASAAPRRIRSGGRWRVTPVYRREQLAAQAVPGPLLALDYGATTLIPAGWSASVDASGNLLARSG